MQLHRAVGSLTGGFAVKVSIFVHSTQCVHFAAVTDACDFVVSFAGTRFRAFICQPFVSHLHTQKAKKKHD